MDIEKAVIARCLTTQGFLAFQKHGIKAAHFSDEKSKQIYQYIIKIKHEDGQLPTAKELRNKFKFIETDDTSLRTNYLVAAFKDNWKRVRLMNLMHEVKATIKNGDDPSLAVRSVNKHVTELSGQFSSSQDVDLSRAVDDVTKLCEETRKRGGISGIPFPWDELNRVSGGLNDEDFILLCSRPKAGKTWIAMFILACCVRAGKRVLFISKDMSRRYIERRYVGLRAKIPYRELKTGQLTTISVRKMQKLKNKLRWDKGQALLIEDDFTTETGINFIDAKCEEHKPDLVIIDGVYLLADDNGATEERIRLRAVSKDCKRLARRRKIPVLAIHQMTRDKASKKTGEAGASGLYGSDGFLQDADLGIEIVATKEMKQEKRRKLVVFASREGEECSFSINFDIDSYDFGFLETDDDEEVEEDLKNY